MRRRRLVRLASAVTVVIAVAATACSSDDQATGALTRSDIEERSGLDLPDSVAEFRATRIGNEELHVAATIAAADVDELTTDDSLDLVAGTRVITHASPLWDMNPTGEITGGTSTFEGVTRNVEVVTDGTDRAAIRLSLRGL